MYKTNILNCDNELLEKQKQVLVNDIVFGEKTDYFKIHSMEAGTGKTRTAEYALAKMVKETGHNAILVRNFNKDCDESAKLINDMVGDEVVLPYYNTPNRIRFPTQNDFSNYRIVAITHQRYLQLSKNSKQKNIFIKDRDTLVIDEYIDDVKRLIFSKEKVYTFNAILMFDVILHRQYMKIISEIEDILLTNASKNKYQELRISSRNSINKEVNYLKRLIKSNMNSEKVKSIINSISDNNGIDTSLIEKISTVNQLCREVECIKQFYSQPVILHAGVIYAPDSRVGYWTLERNIILDASAELQPAYIANPKMFRITNKEKVLDHSNWILTNVIVNSTRSGKEKYSNFYDKVNEYLSKNFDTNSMLLIGNKNEIPLISCIEEENKAYFGNLIGSNAWHELKNVAIIQSPNISDVDYLLKHLHFTRYLRLYSRRYIWATRKDGKGIRATHAFTDEGMENIRVHFISGEIYQAIKRVNRCMNGKTNIILFCNYDKVVNLIREHLKGCRFQSIDDIEFARIETRQDRYIANLKNNSYASMFKALLAELSYGKHKNLIHNENDDYFIFKKKCIREYQGINDAANFRHQVLDKTDVIAYCKSRGILTHGQCIQIPKKKVVPISI